MAFVCLRVVLMNLQQARRISLNVLFWMPYLNAFTCEQLMAGWLVFFFLLSAAYGKMNTTTDN